MGVRSFLKSAGKAVVKGGLGFLAGGPAGAALAAGGSIYGDIKNRGKVPLPGGPGATATGMVAPAGQQAADENRFRGMTEQEAARAKTLTGAADTGMAAYDPSKYAMQAAGAQAKQFGQIGQGMETQRRLSTNRRGFLGAPMGAGANARNLNTQIATQVASNAQTAAGQKLGQLNAQAGVAENAQARSFEATSDIANTGRATIEQARADANAKSASKKNLIGNIAGAAIGAAGTYLARRK